MYFLAILAKCYKIRNVIGLPMKQISKIDCKIQKWGSMLQDSYQFIYLERHKTLYIASTMMSQ